MNLLANKWRAGLGPIDEGLYFASDDLVPLFGHPGQGYTRGDRQQLAAWLENPQGDWAPLDEKARYETEDWTIVGGGTSWEGAGFLALQDRRSEELLWLLLLNESAPFLEIRIEGEDLVALSGAQPKRYSWTVPLGSPESFRVREMTS